MTLTLTDEQGVCAQARLSFDKQAANQPERALATLREQLAKLGNTLFVAEAVEIDLPQPWFIPVSALNRLRRDGIAALEANRQQAHRRPRRQA